MFAAGFVNIFCERFILACRLVHIQRRSVSRAVLNSSKFTAPFQLGTAVPARHRRNPRLSASGGEAMVGPIGGGHVPAAGEAARRRERTGMPAGLLELARKGLYELDGSEGDGSHRGHSGCECGDGSREVISN